MAAASDTLQWRHAGHRWIPRWITQKMFPFDDVIMACTNRILFQAVHIFPLEINKTETTVMKTMGNFNYFYQFIIIMALIWRFALCKHWNQRRFGDDVFTISSGRQCHDVWNKWPSGLRSLQFVIWFCDCWRPSCHVFHSTQQVMFKN